jgi:formylglycine-generating enzyme required for sulfatase activity
LRPFGPEDRAFFLDLLPGPRDHTRLPEAIRFWKVRIESPDPDRTFAVGLLYGPSGCGKSSLVKAGLLPQLEPAVVPVYVEATRENTEDRLLAQLRKKCPGLGSRASLRTTLARLRQRRGLPEGAKVLVVLDQFEQWLHAHAQDMESTELVATLRQADGEHVQVLLLVRADFWMSISRLFESLKINLDRARNTRAVELFGESHAHHVLHLFGTAYGQLPSEGSGLTADQAAFLARAVEELSGDGGVIPVRLSLFADMMKNRPWTPAELEKVGGTRGVAVKFLEDVFSQPGLRARKGAAQALLQALLPAPGADLKGRMRSRRELAAASSLLEESPAFAQLLESLGREYLLTPTDPSPLEGTADAPQASYYQLTHDYLVPSLREWLTEEKRKTWKGRAELRLDDRSALWNARPQNQVLPAAWEFVNIWLFTRPRTWTGPERRMMRSATWYLALRACGVVVVLALAGLIAFEGNGVVQAQAKVTELNTAEIGDVREIIRELAPYRRWANPRLLRLAQESSGDLKRRRNVHLALLPAGAAQVDFLVECLLAGKPEEVGVLAGALKEHQPDLAGRFWEVLEDRDADADRRLRAACALAVYDPASPRWQGGSRDLVAKLVTEPLTLLPGWQKELEPVGRSLVPPLIDVVRDAGRPEMEHSVAASLLADYARDLPETLAELVKSLDARQGAVLLPALLKYEQRAVASMNEELDRSLAPDWRAPPPDAAWATPDATLVQKLEAAHGLLEKRFALCQTMPLDQFLGVADGLRPCGYRPVCFRPYAVGDAVRVAAIWTRDGRPYRLLADVPAAEIDKQDVLLRQSGYWPLDVAGYRTDASKLGPRERYAALWVIPEIPVSEAKLYVGASADTVHQAALQKLPGDGFFPMTQMVLEGDDYPMYCAVWWKRRRALQNAFHGVAKDAAWFERNLTPSELLTDVRLSPNGRRVDYAASWHASDERVSAELHGVEPGRQLERGRELMTAGYRPVSLSAVSLGEGEPLVTALVWHRPVVPEAAKEDLARRQARAAATLLRLGKPERVWPLLRWSPDPRVRTYLIHHLFPLGTEPQALLRHLDEESDVSARRALLLSLGEFPADRFPGAGGTDLVARLLQMYESDPDGGIHSAAEWLLRRWGREAELQAAQERLVSREPVGKRAWYVNSQGHTLVSIPGPAMFWMGSPGSEPGRVPQEEALWNAPILRPFALATKEVTAEQFARFLDENPGVRDSYPRKSGLEPDMPASNVSWFEAVQYCRWLSANEHAPESEMCYPPIRDIDPHKEMPPPLLDRTGYRLPLEVEWEYAARAGALTSRAFGGADEMLVHYAWYARNTEYAARPTGRLKPNDWGLFDIYGNVGEWCQDPAPPVLEHGLRRPGPRTAPEGKDATTNDPSRAWRGGAFLSLPSRLRSATTMDAQAITRVPTLGFRIARTRR